MNKIIFKTLVLVFLFNTDLAFANPQKMEMIFLSPKKISMLQDALERYGQMKNSTYFAQAEMEKCVPMGDGCFHPQLGYMEKKESSKEVSTIEERKLELKTFNAIETSLVNCDKNNFFDIFCGKEKANGPPSEIEVWFDVSSSLKTVDYNKDPEHCDRRSFMEKIIEGCKSKVSVSVYNTSLKQIRDNGSACLGYGTNDQAKLLRWMKDSKAKYLLVVTDIDEMSAEMREFLESTGAKMTGDGVKAFTSNDLIDYAREFIKMCR